MPLRAVSLFTGVGGLDFGLEAAGYETVVAVDNDSVACRVLRENRRWPIIEREIERIASKELLRTAAIRKGDADLLAGGPPCQPFSKSGYWATGDAKRLDDPRAGTLSQYLRVLEHLLPRAFLLENVSGLAFAGKSEGLEILRKGISSINRRCATNYTFEVARLNAADFGVPQHRHRIFVVGSRDGRNFSFPAPTHAATGEGRMPRYRTAWDALGDLEDNSDPSLAVSGKWADLLSSIPEGNNYLWHTNRGGGRPLFGWRTRYWNFLLKLSRSEPSWTIQAQPGPATGPFHWKNRKLSVKELARLQTLPEGLIFNCSRVEAQRLIGNAVPSALTELIGQEIKRQILDVRTGRRRVTLLPDDRGPPPPPEKTTTVPRKYLHLVGQHDAHPGTGKGRRALARLVA